MKNFTDILKESLMTEARRIKDPEIGETAYDYNGDKWVIDAYCYADGGAPEGCDSLEALIKKYDISGSMKEMLDDYSDDLPFGNDTFIVGAHLEDDEDEVAAWVWGPEGICFENK